MLLFPLLKLFRYGRVTEKPSKAGSSSTAREPSAELIIFLAVQMHRATFSFKNLPLVRLSYLVPVSGSFRMINETFVLDSSSTMPGLPQIDSRGAGETEAVSITGAHLSREQQRVSIVGNLESLKSRTTVIPSLFQVNNNPAAFQPA